MRVASESVLNRLRATPVAMLRASCVALFVCLSGCGGGSDGGTPPPSSTPPPAPALGITAPPPALATLVVGTPLSIDGGASGNPVELRVVRGANGDGFAVWQASRPEDVTNIPSLLWVNRYRAATGAWGRPVNIATGVMARGDFDLTQKAIGAEHAGKLRAEDLHRHLTGVFQIPREVDGRHATGAEFALNRVAVGER